MAEIHGTYHSVDHPARGREPGSFFILPEDSKIPLLCSGMAYELKKGMPVIVTGEFRDRSESIFLASDISLDRKAKKRMLKFLSGTHFKGLTKKQGEFFYNELIHLEHINGVPFDKLSRDVFRIAASECRIPMDTAECIIDSITGIEDRKRLNGLLLGCRISGGDIETMMRVYGGSAYEKLREHPYDCVQNGVSFSLCDDIAHQEEINCFDTERIQAFFKTASQMIESSGSCCLRLGDLFGFFQKLQRKSLYPQLPNAYFLSILLSLSSFVVKENKKYGMVVYPKALYEAEQEIGQELKRLVSTAEATGYSGCMNTENLDSGQISALRFLKSEGVKILTGGPGSGKTTVIRKFIEEYHTVYPKRPVCLAAPTGRAAVRITESCGGKEKAVTLHKLLDARSFDGHTRFEYNRENRLPVGLYIIDEMSMTDEILFLRLLRAVPEHSILILSGDPDQLPSVQAGTVLKDLVECGQFDHVRLSGNHRQGKGTSIIDNYHKIINRDCSLILDESFSVIRVNNDNDALRALASVYAPFENSGPDDFQILSSVRIGSFGTNRINGLIADAKQAKAGKGMSIARNGYYTGDKIMMVRNNYQKQYWNGDVGIITGFKEGVIYARFYDGIREIDREASLDMEHAFASTVHKSQGAEYRQVVIVLGKEYPSMLSNALILTAVTRARDKVTIITQGDALEQAIQTEKEADRVTGLADTVRDIFA